MPGLKQHIIGLCGYRNVGKDTVADLLVTHAGFMKLAFADPLYAEISEAFGIDVADLRHRSTKELPIAALALNRGPIGFRAAVVLATCQSGSIANLDAFLDAPRSPRQILQWWGTEYRRRQDVNYWTKQIAAIVNYRIHELHERNFVIVDCRYPNEVECVRSMGGELWQVNRPSIEQPQDGHTSNTDGSEFAPDAIVNNLHDVRHLQQEVLGKFWADDAGLDFVRVEIGPRQEATK